MDFGPAGVHAVEFAGEQGGFVAAGGGADFDDDIAVVVRDPVGSGLRSAWFR